MYHCALATIPGTPHSPRFLRAMPPSVTQVRQGVQQPSAACTCGGTEGTVVPETASPPVVRASSRREAPGTSCRDGTSPSAIISDRWIQGGGNQPGRTTRNTASRGSPGSQGKPRRAPTASRGAASLPGLASHPPRPHSSVLGPGGPFPARPTIALRPEPLPKLPLALRRRGPAVSARLLRLGQPGRFTSPPPPYLPAARLCRPPLGDGCRRPLAGSRCPLPRLQTSRQRQRVSMAGHVLRGAGGRGGAAGRWAGRPGPPPSPPRGWVATAPAPIQEPLWPGAGGCGAWGRDARRVGALCRPAAPARPEASSRRKTGLQTSPSGYFEAAPLRL